MNVPGYRETPTRPWHPDDPVDAGEAEEFLRLFHAEHPEAGPVEPRLREVRAALVESGDSKERTVRFRVEAGDLVPAYIFVPKGRTEPGPAILCLHQHADRKSVV